MEKRKKEMGRPRKEERNEAMIDLVKYDDKKYTIAKLVKVFSGEKPIPKQNIYRVLKRAKKEGKLSTKKNLTSNQKFDNIEISEDKEEKKSL